MKTLKHAFHALLVLSLLCVNPQAGADPRPATPSHSFKGGFSSQRSSSPPPRAPRQDGAGRGGFGSFNSAPSGDRQKSDSALSQRLDRNASEANALRTLDARRAAKEQAERDTRPVPGYENRQYGNQAPLPSPMPSPTPAQQSNNGLTGVVAGMVLGQIANGSHARGNNGYPGQRGDATGTGTSSASVNQAPAGTSFFGGVLRLFLWLAVLSALGWLIYFVFRKKRGKAEQNKPNYTFEG